MIGAQPETPDTGTVARTGRFFSHITRRSRPRYSRPIPRLSRGPYVRRRSTAAVSRGATTTPRPAARTHPQGARGPAPRARARRPRTRTGEIPYKISRVDTAGSRSRFIQPSCGHRHCGARAPARAARERRRRRRHQTPRLGTHNTQSQSSLTVNTPFERHPIPRTHATKHLFSATRHITPRARPHDYSDLPTTRPDSTDALPTRMPGGWKGAWTTTSWHEARSSSRAALERAARRRSGVSRWHALSTLY